MSCWQLWKLSLSIASRKLPLFIAFGNKLVAEIILLSKCKYTLKGISSILALFSFLCYPTGWPFSRHASHILVSKVGINILGEGRPPTRWTDIKRKHLDADKLRGTKIGGIKEGLSGAYLNLHRNCSLLSALRRYRDKLETERPTSIKILHNWSADYKNHIRGMLYTPWNGCPSSYCKVLHRVISWI